MASSRLRYKPVIMRFRHRCQIEFGRRKCHAVDGGLDMEVLGSVTAKALASMEGIHSYTTYFSHSQAMYARSCVKVMMTTEWTFGPSLKNCRVYVVASEQNVLSANGQSHSSIKDTQDHKGAKPRLYENESAPQSTAGATNPRGSD